MNKDELLAEMFRNIIWFIKRDTYTFLEHLDDISRKPDNIRLEMDDLLQVLLKINKKVEQLQEKINEEYINREE